MKPLAIFTTFVSLTVSATALDAATLLPIALRVPTAAISLLDPLWRMVQYHLPGTVDMQLTRPAENSTLFSHWSGFVKRQESTSEVWSTIEVPKLSKLFWKGRPQVPAGDAWVGIGGYSCPEGSVRAGITWKLVNGQTKYTAWSQWIPLEKQDFDLYMEAGDRVEIRIHAPDDTTAVATVVNHSTGQSVSRVFKNPPAPLCRRSAEWIVSYLVEQSEPDFSIVPDDIWSAIASLTGITIHPFADYGHLKFKAPGRTAGQAGKDHGMFNPKELRMGFMKTKIMRMGEVSRCKMGTFTRDISCRYVQAKPPTQENAFGLPWALDV